MPFAFGGLLVEPFEGGRQDWFKQQERRDMGSFPTWLPTVAIGVGVSVELDPGNCTKGPYIYHTITGYVWLLTSLDEGRICILFAFLLSSYATAR